MELNLKFHPMDTAPKDGSRILVWVSGELSYIDPSSGIEYKNWDVGWFVVRWEKDVRTGGHKVGLREDEYWNPPFDGAWVAGGYLWSDATIEFTNVREQPRYWARLPDKNL